MHRQPWEHWPDHETAKEYSLFWRWLCAGASGAATSRVARDHGLSLHMVESLIREKRWKERAAAEEAHLRAVRTAAAEQAAETSGKRVAGKALRALDAAADAAIFELADLRNQQETSGRGGLLSPRDAVKLACAIPGAIKALGLGEGDEPRPDEDLDLSQLTDAELATWRGLAAKARKTAP